MVTYTIEALRALVGTKPVGPIDPIHERPTFSSLWHLQQHLVEGLRKVTNTAYTNDGHSGYILSREAFALYLTKEWQEPADVGECFGTPPFVHHQDRTENQRKKMGSTEREARHI